MHAEFDPERRAMVTALLRGMGGLDVLNRETVGWSVTKDGNRAGVWPTARRAWLDSRRYLSSHHLVIQDDAIVCRDFLAGVKAIVAIQPEAAITLYANRKVVEEAREQGSAWASYRDGPWGLAVVMPSAWASDFLRWEAAAVPSSYPHDDRRLGLWLWNEGKPCLGVVPSIVEHGGWKHSTMGHSNPRSRARWFLGIDKSALSVDWTKGASKPLEAKPNYSLTWLRREVLG
jgi:hypothetical protein